MTDEEVKLINEYYKEQNKILIDENLTGRKKFEALVELSDRNAWLLSRNSNNFGNLSN